MICEQQQGWKSGQKGRDVAENHQDVQRRDGPSSLSSPSQLPRLRLLLPGPALHLPALRASPALGTGARRLRAARLGAQH